MAKVRNCGLLVWLALFCSLLLPLTAWGEMRGPYQQEALNCGMADCRCDCCPKEAAHVSGCRGCSGSVPCLSPGGMMLYHWQASPHRLQQITPVFKAFGADIFHPPELSFS